MKKILVVSLIIACAAMLADPKSAQAYEVAPMRITLVPAEGQRGASISVNNNESRNLQVEIKIFRRLIDEDGTQTLDPADDDFTVFPPQVEIPVGKSQSVRFQYVGPPVRDVSVAYVVQVVELPVNDPAFSGVRFTYNFGVAVYLDPPKATEKLQIVSAEHHGSGVRLQVRNDGTRYGVVIWKRLILEMAGQRLELTPDMLGQRISNPLVPPRSNRTIDVTIPEWEAIAPTGDVHAQLLAPNS